MLGDQKTASLIQRSNTYYLQWRIGKKIKRRSLGISSFQIAKENLRQFESAQYKGRDNSLRAKTLLTEIITKYVEHIRNIKTENSAQTDVYYLR